MAGKKTMKAKNAVATANSAVGSVKRVGPVIKGTPNGCRIQNEEFLASVGGGSTMNFLLGLGPGSSTFRWVRHTASGYAKYRVHKFEVSYVSTVGSAIDGSLAMGFFYDVTDATHWSDGLGYSELIACGGSMVGPVYGQTLGQSFGRGTMTMAADTALAHAVRPWFYTGGSSAQPAIENQNNWAYIGWRTSGVTGNGTVGNLIVRYDIEFINPVYESSASPFTTLSTKPDWFEGRQEDWDRIRTGPRKDPAPLPPPKPKPDEDTSVEGLP